MPLTLLPPFPFSLYCYAVPTPPILISQFHSSPLTSTFSSFSSYSTPMWLRLCLSPPLPQFLFLLPSFPLIPIPSLISTSTYLSLSPLSTSYALLQEIYFSRPYPRLELCSKVHSWIHYTILYAVENTQIFLRCRDLILAPNSSHLALMKYFLQTYSYFLLFTFGHFQKSVKILTGIDVQENLKNRQGCKHN